MLAGVFGWFLVPEARFRFTQLRPILSGGSAELSRALDSIALHWRRGE